MPKINRKYLHSNVFHIMVQGINKEYIFERNKEKQKYRKLIKEELKSNKEALELVLLKLQKMNISIRKMEKIFKIDKKKIKKILTC